MTTPQHDVQLCQGTYQSEAAGREQLARFAATYANRSEWEQRAGRIREGLLRGLGLLSPPARHPLRPIVHSRRDYRGYSVQNVAIESLPGFFVSGNLYRPRGYQGPFAGILCPHGHFYEPNGGGRFRPDQQRRCATLARMGAIVFSYDMVGWGESTQFLNYEFPGSHERCPIAAALQTWNSIRSLDFLAAMEEVDSRRLGITGASGGATQAFLLTAVDDRVSATVLAVMVSAHFFGGCNCESGMPIHKSPTHETNNVEISALAAPRPLLLISGGSDWTKNTPTVEFPHIRRIYQLYEAEENVENVHLPYGEHNYSRRKREAAYAFLARHLELEIERVSKADGTMDERGIPIEQPSTMQVFDQEHPRPSSLVVSQITW